ncbi:Bug family tripartite tricarboxylate transporter substrate binding protein [Hydrogenophaga sp.]|uniref:Bug family tripartite tricarboxylate transporter substrate binding protein n=1 Tax=Hydrogenophaga sp. TaxID=1904254 RepID=UPI003F6ED164
MSHPVRALMAGLAAWTALAWWPVMAQQATFPSRPLRIVVPYAAGGLSDVQIRAVAEPLGKLLGQPVIVDNKPGATGAIGTQAVATATPDGHTLVFANNGFVMTPHLNRQAGYDALMDFSPVSRVSLTPMVLLVHNEVPASTMTEFIDYIRYQRAPVEYGSVGTASFGHMSMALLAQAASMKMVHVPYRGEAPLLLALRAGQVQALMTPPSPLMMGAVKEGQVKLLGVASVRPAPLLPGVKPIAATVPGFSAEVWFGLFAPSGTPAAHVARLNEALDKVLARPDIQAKFASIGALAAPSTPAAFHDITRAESARWADLIRTTGLKVE